MTAENYNRQGRQMGTEQQWNEYNANNADAIRRAGATNEANLYNIGARATGKANEAASYQNDINNLAQGTSGSIYTPQSQAASDEYAARQGLQQQRLGNTLNLAGTLATGFRAGNVATQPQANPAQPQQVPVKPKIQANMVRRPQ